MFDRGEWGATPTPGKGYNAFGISGSARSLNLNGMPLHGARIRLPEGEDDRGISFAECFPPEVFFRFHFAASVLKHCKGAAEPEDTAPEDEEEPSRVQSSESKLSRFIERLHPPVEGRTILGVKRASDGTFKM